MACYMGQAFPTSPNATISAYQQSQEKIAKRNAQTASLFIAAAFAGAAAMSWKKSKTRGVFFAGASVLSLAAPFVMYGMPEFGKVF